MKHDPAIHALHVNPYRALVQDAGPLQIGDIVTVLFSHTSPEGEDRRGTVIELYRFDRFKVEVTFDDGATECFSVPRDLLQLVRRADA